MEGKVMANVKVLRNNPDSSQETYYDSYQVPFDPKITVMDVLQHIYGNVDSSLAHRCACNAGYCNVCIVRCNGKNINPCLAFMSKDMVIEPVSGKEVIRDLVISFSSSKDKKEI